VFIILGLGKPDVRAALSSHRSSTNHTNSVRAKVRNFEDEAHYFGKDFYPRCLYLGEDGDPERVEDGYLKSALLVKVTSLRQDTPALHLFVF
jgi:hypothetical protein